ncbi:hypothetical protein FOZ63_011587 [Perkinsus olseni]|uniref:PDZ domain-containing protein n=1 Tax=Perkinsus olseni TaxID=32597 RepID=A0A7J6SZM9_PEROL|nr:hypothetical protein FOZ63_011587 [Perkinsus olseni]
MGANNCCDREAADETAKTSSEVLAVHGDSSNAFDASTSGYREAPPSISEYGGGDLSMEASVVEASPPLGPLPGVESRGKKMWIVTIEKGGSRLGIDVDHNDPSYLLVEGVTGGVVGAYNGDHPAEALQPGDHIVEVNGVRGDSLGMITRCKADDRLTMSVERELFR